MRKALLTLFVLALTIGCASAQAKQESNDLLTTTKLENGLEVILVENHAVPLVTVEIAVRTGAYTETPKTDGLAHLYEHMFFKGNAALPNQEAYQKREAELGISSNGTTSTEAVKYFVTLPSYYLEEGVEFMSHALLTPNFDPGELKNETKVVLGEYDRNESNPAFFLRKSVRQKLFHAYYYRKNPIGDRNAIILATPALLKDFKERYYVPNNSALIIQGDFDPKTAMAFAKHFFGSNKWKAGADPHAQPLPAHPPITKNDVLIVNRDYKQAMAQFGQYGPNIGADAKQTWETYVADVLGTLVALPQSKFQRTLVDSGLCAGASWGYYTQHDGGEMSAMLVATPDRIEKAVAALKTELANFAVPGYFTEAELRAAQRQLEVSTTFARESGQQFAVDLAFWWAIAGIEYFLEYIPNIQKVTLKDLAKFAKEWIVGKPSVLGVLISPENQAKTGLTLAKLGAVEEKAASTSTLHETKLSNGLRVIHKPVQTNDVVALQLFIDGGSTNITAENAGVEALLLTAMLKGSKNYSKNEFQSRLGALGASVGSAVNYDFSTISIKCLKRDFAEVLDLVSDAIRHPLLEDSEIAKIRSRMEQGLLGQESDPDAMTPIVCNEIFFRDHPYSNQPKGTLASVKKLTREKVVAHYDRIFKSGQLLIVVVGDVDLGLVEKAFGSLPAGSYTRPRRVSYQQVEGVELNVVPREIPTAYVLGKFPAPSIADDDYAALQVGLDMLSDNLWDAVRTKAALSYAVFSGMSSYDSNYGYLYVTSTKPNDCIKLMYAEVHKMQAGEFEATDVKASALKLYTRHFMRNEPNGGQAGGIGRGALIGGGADAYDRVMDRVRNVTAEDVQKAVRKYMKLYQFGIFGPKEWIDPAVFQKS
jgi:zinc protease